MRSYIKCDCCETYILSGFLYEVYKKMPNTIPELNRKIFSRQYINKYINLLLELGIIKIIGKRRYKINSRHFTAVLYDKTEVNVIEYKKE